jgi:hypothetical protein
VEDFPMKMIVAITSALFAGAVAAQLVVYPAEGQTAEQQKQDEAECYAWAVDNSGYDPANPPVAQTPSQPQGASGSRLRGAAKGALVGEIADGDTGDAALAGAVMGGSRERRDRRRTEQEAVSTAQAKQQQGQASFNKARAACLEGRGYSVK